MDFFLNRPYDLESSDFSSLPILAEKKKKDDLLESRFDDLLNTNEIFKLLLRRINSESRLNDLNLNGTQDPRETDSNDINARLKSEDYISQRKRSDTFPGTAIIERKRNVGTGQIEDFLSKKIEKKSESLLNGLMNKNSFDKSLVRRISSESCLLDAQVLEDAKVIQHSEASIPQRKRSDTFPSAVSFGRKRKVGIATNYIGTLKPGTGRLYCEQNSRGSTSRLIPVGLPVIVR